MADGGSRHARHARPSQRRRGGSRRCSVRTATAHDHEVNNSANSVKACPVFLLLAPSPMREILRCTHLVRRLSADELISTCVLRPEDAPSRDDNARQVQLCRCLASHRDQAAAAVSRSGRLVIAIRVSASVVTPRAQTNRECSLISLPLPSSRS